MFATYMRDVDVSPDGSHFVVATTGAYRAGSLCDTAARWETGAIGAGQQPTWADYTGGDTLYSVAVTGTAAYVGGRARDPLPPGDLFRLGLDGATAGPPSPVAAGVDWSTFRAAFAVSGRLYTGHADGTMTVRTFDGAAGPAIPIALNGLTSTQFPISRIIGMFLWNGRLYYTLNGGDPRLYYHWFTPESGTIGADTFVASGAGDGRNWSTVNGMTMASGRLLFASSTGTLSTVDFSGGLPTGPTTVVSGPATDGQSWQSRALFVLNPAN